jgi:hypothetical protein
VVLSKRAVLAIIAVVVLAIAGMYFAFLRPTSPTIPATYTPHSAISITTNDEFNASNGVVRGTGTSSDPYVIEGWEIGSSNISVCIYIINTDVHFVISKVHLTHAAKGIFFQSVIHGRVENSLLDNLTVGVTVAVSDSCAIVDNAIRNCSTAIQIMEASNMNIAGNSFVNNDVNVQQPSQSWIFTWVGTALCLAVTIPLAIVVIAAAYVRLRSKYGQGPEPPST